MATIFSRYVRFFKKNDSYIFRCNLSLYNGGYQHRNALSERKKKMHHVRGKVIPFIKYFCLCLIHNPSAVASPTRHKPVCTLLISATKTIYPLAVRVCLCRDKLYCISCLTRLSARLNKDAESAALVRTKRPSSLCVHRFGGPWRQPCLTRE